jgi:hypothetical protein
MLTEIEEGLLKVVGTPPDLPLVSSGIVDSIAETCNVAFELVGVPESRLLHIHDTLDAAYETICRLYSFIDELFRLCYAAWDVGIRLHPDPCDIVTLDYFIEWIVRDFGELAKHVKPALEAKLKGEIKVEIKEKGEWFMDRLQHLSSTCVQFLGVNCLKYASPGKVIRSPLRAHVIDLVSAVRLIDSHVAKSYHGVREWRVGDIRLYEHPKTTGELLDLAEHVANVVHKIIEVGIGRPWWKDRIVIYSLADRVEIIVERTVHIVAKPRWVVDVYLIEFERYKVFIEPMRRILSERGFETELTDYGFKITTPLGDVREAVKLASALSASLLMYITDVAKAYEIALSDIELLESKMKGQKPLKKRKISL